MQNKVKNILKKYQKLTFKEILEFLQIDSQNPKDAKKYLQLVKALEKLEKQNLVLKNKKLYIYNELPKVKKDFTITGKLKLISLEYGFVLTNSEEYGDIFVTRKDLLDAFDGDIVEVKISNKRSGKNLHGTVLKVLEKSQAKYTGILRKTDSQVFISSSLPFTNIIYPQGKIPKKVLDGSKVIFHNLSFIGKTKKLSCQIERYISNMNPIEEHVIELVSEFNLRYEFPQGVIQEAESIENGITQEEINKRVDLRNEIVFTIDPFDAKDFDDAVSIKQLENGNYLVGVHIADVSHYVRPNTSLDKEALLRGNSVYFVGKCVPMLPEKLSNNLCSLVPNEDRLTFSAFIELSPKGTIKHYKFAKSVINSKRRFTYDEAQEILETGKGDFADELLLLNKLAKQLKKRRIYAGGLEFSSNEVSFKLDEKGIPIEVSKKTLKDSNFLIEEFMLLANKVVATFVGDKLKKFALPFVYRIHEDPDFSKIQELSLFLQKLGYNYTTEILMKSEGIQKLLQEIEGKPEEALINDIMIRSMAKAIYSEENIGHFGLGFKFYTHFTSPIRRYADLIVHRLLFDYINTAKPSIYSKNKLKDICKHISTTERVAADAERKSLKIKQIEFMSNFVGEEFEGIISGVLQFGFFVELIDNLAEGLVHINDLDDDNYYFDSKTYSLKGKRTKNIYRLGDKVKVRLLRVDTTKRTMNFMVVGKMQ